MPRNLKLYITGLVATSALALGATSLVFPGLSAWPLGVDPEALDGRGDHGLGDEAAPCEAVERGTILDPKATRRRVLGIDSMELIWGLGSFHCISQQEPA